MSTGNGRTSIPEGKAGMCKGTRAGKNLAYLLFERRAECTEHGRRRKPNTFGDGAKGGLCKSSWSLVSLPCSHVLIEYLMSQDILTFGFYTIETGAV